VEKIALQAERHGHRRISLQGALERHAGLARKADVGPDRIVDGARGLAARRAEREA
jgi:hypothetical protein